MTNIVWIGNHFFSKALERPGLTLHRIDPEPGHHIGWAEIKSRVEQPDLVVVADKSLPPFVLGMEDFPCLTALYVVDSHIHSWFPYYAQAFDICMVSLKDHLPRFLDERLSPEQVLWMPPYSIPDPISPAEAAAHEKKWDLLFVGTMNPKINPQRIAWLEEFRSLEPRLHLTSGYYRDLNLYAKLILNHSIAGDLNFRVVETLACGCPLLSPRLGHGLEELFTDGEDLFLFEQSDIHSAARMAAKLLDNPELLLESAWNGYNKVTAKHLAVHRADRLLDLCADWTQSGRAAELIKNRRASAREIRGKYLKLIYLLLADSHVEYQNLREAYLAAATKSD